MGNLEQPLTLSKTPLLPTVLALAAGILTCGITDGMWLPVAAVISACLAIFLKRFTPAILCVAFALGFIAATFQRDSFSSESIPDKPMFYKAEIKEVRENDNSQSATIYVSNLGIDSISLKECRKFKASLTIPNFQPELQPGYELIFKATFEPIEIMTDLPDERSPAESLLHRNIYVRTIIKPDDIIGIAPGGSISAHLARFRAEITDIIYRSQLSTSAKEFLNTALLGDTSDLTIETRETFSAAGLSHILALSGLHVGIILMIISLALWPFQALGHRKTIIAVKIILIWLYAGICGFSPSVTRAVIMATIYLTGKMLQRRTSSINSLCAAALIILVFDPASIESIGFQLSFAAVLSIILFADKINPIPRKHHFAYCIATYICVSVSAMLGTAVIAVYYFHSMPVYFIIANVVAAIILPITISLSALMIIFQQTEFISSWICPIIDFLYNILERTAEFIASLPGSTIYNIYIPAWITILYAATFAALYFWLQRKKIRYGYLFSLLFIATTAVFIFQPAPKHDPAIYIARTTQFTNLIIDDGSSTLHILTTAPQEAAAARIRAEKRYRDFMGKRGIDSLNVIPTSKHQEAGYSDNILNVGNKRIAIIHTSKTISGRKTDYALVCRGYRKSISDIKTSYQPDTIILSYDLHPLRSSKYYEECKNLGIPVINMRDKSWKMAIR